MKISIITVVYNGETFIKDCIESVISQTYKNIEYIVIDGNSTDGTQLIIEQYQRQITRYVSEDDNGLYDALNKGINLATGDIIGILNADDFFANDDVIQKVADIFLNDFSVEALYGDLNYIHPLNKSVIRQWKSKEANETDLKRGWMPAHPTLYLKNNLFEKYGKYALNLGTAADYDLILRFFYTYKIKAYYLPILMIKMRIGGLSNQSYKSLYHAFLNDYKALKRNQLPNPIFILLLKKLSKIKQFW
ncbi:glycosyltransferase family 2 protein [Pedobacter lithocola]|uniref:Glycosyltransferase family 2 protein n=1 Tax=Pedobacter lithocola TaxID=1908239 RepID=A0ABV8PF07_9SPHI